MGNVGTNIFIFEETNLIAKKIWLILSKAFSWTDIIKMVQFLVENISVWFGGGRIYDVRYYKRLETISDFEIFVSKTALSFSSPNFVRNQIQLLFKIISNALIPFNTYIFSINCLPITIFTAILSNLENNFEYWIFPKILFSNIKKKPKKPQHLIYSKVVTK